MRKAIEKHIKENIKEYFILALIFIIGLFIGTMVLNNSNENQSTQIAEYLNNFNQNLQQGRSINYLSMLFEILKKDIKLVLLMTFLSVSVIGIPALYFIVGYKGFNIGYTIAAITATFGFGKGLLFSTSLMLLNKIIEIPAILFLAISGIKMYKTIIKNRSKENIKGAITRFAINILISLILFGISALAETYLSSNLFLIFVKYF